MQLKSLEQESDSAITLPQFGQTCFTSLQQSQSPIPEQQEHVEVPVPALYMEAIHIKGKIIIIIKIKKKVKQLQLESTFDWIFLLYLLKKVSDYW